jgi:hypothetical protein
VANGSLNENHFEVIPCFTILNISHHRRDDYSVLGCSLQPALDYLGRGELLRAELFGGKWPDKMAINTRLVSPINSAENSQITPKQSGR